MKVEMSLDVSTPEEVEGVLRRAAEEFYDAESNLRSAWQDEGAGRVWRELAKIMERASRQCEDAVRIPTAKAGGFPAEE